ncbi:lipopolysaccharide biosynthesis protein [Sporosarcina sp. G11-34]|nr:lipopolysaccharide biosynthesis protein [Sporosarcina sp. G11-34]
MLRNIKSGMFWTFLGTFTQTVLQVILLVVMSRILTPQDFGIANLSLAIIAFLSIFSLMGIGPAVIQKQDLTNIQIKIAFFLSITFGLIIVTVLYFGSNLISSFFNTNELQNVIKILTISVIIQSIIVVPESLLNRKLKFKYLATVQIFSYIGYFLFSIIFAMILGNYWAIVISYIMQNVIKFFFIIPKVQMDFKVPLVIRESRELLKFGIGISISRIFNQVALQGDNFVVGKMLGSTSLGNYSRAYQLISMPITIVNTAMDKVMFPILSKEQTNDKLLKQFFIKMLTINVIISLCIIAFLLNLTDIFVLIVLGNQWDTAIIAIKILSLSILFRGGYKISDTILKSKGKVYVHANLQFFYATSVITFTVIGSRWGIQGVSWGVFLSILLNFIIVTSVCMKYLKVKINSLFKGNLKLISLFLFCELLFIITKSKIVFVNSSITSEFLLFIAVFGGFFYYCYWILIKNIKEINIIKVGDK